MVSLTANEIKVLVEARSLLAEKRIGATPNQEFTLKKGYDGLTTVLKDTALEID